MSYRLVPHQGIAGSWRQQRLARVSPLRPAVLCSSRVPRERRVALEVELEVVRERAQSAAARGRRLSEKAALLRHGEARAADAATLARLQRDRKVVLQGLSAVLRRLDIYRQFASKVEEYLAAAAAAAIADDELNTDTQGR